MNEEVFYRFPVLRFDEFELKAISMDDIAEIQVLCSYRPPDKRTSSEELLDLINKEYLEKNGINWGIYLKDKLIGTIGFYRGFENNEAEIGYVLIEEYRNQAITSRAVKLLSHFAIDEMGINKVKAYTSPQNKASQKVLLKCNFTEVRADNTDDLKYVFTK